MLERIRKMSVENVIRSIFCGFTALCFLSIFFTGDLNELFSGYARILTKPSILTKDYFCLELGSVSGSMLNYFVVSAFCTALTFLPGAVVNGTTVAAFFLTVGFCSWGLNIVNILPFFAGTFLYSVIKKKRFASMMNMALFSTALAPMISEMLWRYPMEEARSLTFTGVLLALFVGIVTGVSLPALCAHAQNFHKGYDLYNAGPATGFLCFLLFTVLYKNGGVTAPAISAVLSEGKPIFCNIFDLVFFIGLVVYGWLLNGRSFKGLLEVEKDDSYKVDFTAQYPIGCVVMHFGLYGLFLQLYFNLIGATFTGVTFGVMFCMLCFAMAGSTPKNVFPILLGYVLFSYPGVNAINAQAIVVGVCFASGLAPITGRYGFLAGMAAGAMHYCLVTSVPAIHGGFSLYNGGFTAGITGFLMVGILEHFFKPKNERKVFRF